MRTGPQYVVRGLAKRLILLLVGLAALMLTGRVEGAGVAAGLLVAFALVTHVTAFGVATATRAAPPARLRIAAVAGVLLAAIAGVWASGGSAFAFLVARIGGLTISVGGALMHVAAALAVAGAGAFVFVAIAGRASALGDQR